MGKNGLYLRSGLQRPCTLKVHVKAEVTGPSPGGPSDRTQGVAFGPWSGRLWPRPALGASGSPVAPVLLPQELSIVVPRSKESPPKSAAQKPVPAVSVRNGRNFRQFWVLVWMVLSECNKEWMMFASAALTRNPVVRSHTVRKLISGEGPTSCASDPLCLCCCLST